MLRTAVGGVALGAVLLTTGCAPQNGAPHQAVTVVTTFYPLAFVAEQVGGAHVNVSNLTKPGAEPHDLELAASQVGELGKADLVVYLATFQPAVDDAVAQQVDPQHTLEAGAAAALDVTTGGRADPHFWLDPTKLAAVADAVSERLSALDPEHADQFSANRDQLNDRLRGLDQRFSDGLATCRSRVLVTSHEAFGYLAARYGLTQKGIAGLSAEADPTPRQLADAAAFVRDNAITTIFYETLVDPSVADTVAGETGATTAVLDPIEGLTKQSAGAGYIEVMDANLQSLRTGLACS